MVKVVDSASALASTGTSSNDDLHVHVVDEYKFSTHSTLDASMERASKNEQSLVTSGYLVHERLVQDPVTREYSKKKYVTLERRFTITSTNHIQNVPKSHLSRMCIMPVPTLTAEEKQAGPTPGQFKAGDDNERTRTIASAWQLVLKTLCAQQAFYWAAESVGAFPAIDTTCFEVFWNIVETVLGTEAMSMRRNGDIRDLAISVMVWNVIRTWYVDGLGASLKYDRGLQLMWYARTRYLRMEDICIAFMYLESSRSTAKHSAAIMRSIKLQLHIEDGALVTEDGDPNYWKLRCTSGDLETRVSRSNPQLGKGLCITLLDAMRHGCTHGGPNVMTSKTGSGTCVVNKKWISTVTTLEEAAIVRMMKAHAYVGSSLAHPDYENEHKWVFVSKFRNQLTGTQEPTFPEIAKLKRSSVSAAFCMLQCRCIPGTQTPAIRLESQFTVAKYRAVDHDGAQPSIAAPDRTKISAVEHTCMVVDPSLWLHDPVVAESPVDNMLRTALIVAGSYTNTRVTAGFGRSMEGIYKDNSYDIAPDATATVSIENPYYSESTYGPGSVLHELFDDELVFKRDMKVVTLDESSNIERRVRKLCESKAPVSDKISKTFANALHTAASE